MQAVLDGRRRKVRKPLPELTPELCLRWYRGRSAHHVRAYFNITRSTHEPRRVFIDIVSALYLLQFLKLNNKYYSLNISLKSICICIIYNFVLNYYWRKINRENYSSVYIISVIIFKITVSFELHK